MAGGFVTSLSSICECHERLHFVALELSKIQGKYKLPGLTETNDEHAMFWRRMSSHDAVVQGSSWSGLDNTSSVLSHTAYSKHM